MSSSSKSPITSYREAHKLSQQAFVSLLRRHGCRTVGQWTVSRWETGKAPIGLAEAFAVERATAGEIRAQDLARPRKRNRAA